MKKSFFNAMVFVLALTVLATFTVFAEDPVNLLEGQEWESYMSSAEPEKRSDDGEYVALSGISKAYTSAGINIYPAVTKALEETDEASLYLKFEARFVPDGGSEEFPCAFLIRAKGIDESYESDTSFFRSKSGGNFYTRVTSAGQISLTPEWQEFEFEVYVEADFLDDAFTGWMFCMDNMSELEGMKEINIRNLVIYSEDDYEPADDEPADDKPTAAPSGNGTPEPIALNTPINFNKYPITFGKVNNNDAPAASEGNNTPVATVTPAPEEPVSDSEESGNSSQTLIIIIAAAVAVIALGAMTFVLIKKSKSRGKNE